MIKVFKNIKLLFYVNSITLPFTFFSVLTMLSIEYKGIDENNSYLFAMLFSASIVYYFFFKNLIQRKIFLVAELIFYILPVIILLNGVIAVSFFNIPCEKDLYNFIIFVIPAFLFGTELGRSESLYIVLPYFLLVAIINTIGFVSVIPKMITSPTAELISFYGGGHYQAFSYSISFAFLILFVYYLFYDKNNNWKKSLFFIFVFSIHLIGIILSGGRGGLVVIFVGTLLSLFIRFPVWRVFLYIFVFSIIIFALGFVALSFLGEFQERIFESSERLFSYISTSGVSMEQTSNRDQFYNEALNFIYKEPLFGYGLFRYLGQTGGWYPHNFFLEVLLQGGFLYLFFWVFIFCFFVFRLKFLFTNNKNHFLIISTLVYSFIQLLFTGTYLLEPMFWFSLAYVFTSTSRILVNFDSSQTLL